MALGGLAKSLSKSGRDAAAEPYCPQALQVLERIPASGDTLRVSYARGQIAVRCGEMYVNLAGSARGEQTSRYRYLHKAHDALTLGVKMLAKVNESYALGGAEKQVWDDGIAALKLVDSRLGAHAN
jgi:hypothetical protein